MPIADALLGEYDHESASTRKLLALCPDAKATWKPHAKSMSLGGLAMHLVEIPIWLIATAQQDEFDVAPVGGPAYQSPKFTSIADALKAFDVNTAKARAALAATTDPAMMKPWSLKKGGVAMFTMPKVVVMRSFVFNHAVHHRGQLTVYLRLLDVKLPAIYGPSADAAM